MYRIIVQCWSWERFVGTIGMPLDGTLDLVMCKWFAVCHQLHFPVTPHMVLAEHLIDGQMDFIWFLTLLALLPFTVDNRRCKILDKSLRGVGK